MLDNFKHAVPYKCDAAYFRATKCTRSTETFVHSPLVICISERFDEHWHIMNGACVMRSTKRMPHWVRRNESYVNSDTVIMSLHCQIPVPFRSYSASLGIWIFARDFNCADQCSSDNTFCHRRISRYLEQFPTFLHYGVAWSS